MALATKLGADIPEGAVALTRREALEYQKNIIQKWPLGFDSIFLKLGGEITFLTSVASTTVVCNYFRRAMNVKKSALLFIVPTLCLPAYGLGMYSHKVITNNILLMQIKCPMCNQLKFAAAQAYFGVVFPIFYGFSVFGLLAQMNKTYDFGNISTKPILFWQELFKILKGGTRTYQIAGLMQTVLILTLPYMQTSEFQRIYEKIRQENMMDESSEGDITYS